MKISRVCHGFQFFDVFYTITYQNLNHKHPFKMSSSKAKLWLRNTTKILGDYIFLPFHARSRKLTVIFWQSTFHKINSHENCANKKAPALSTESFCLRIHQQKRAFLWLFHTYGGYVTGTKPLAFGGGLFIAAKRACTSQYNLLFKL